MVGVNRHQNTRRCLKINIMTLLSLVMLLNGLMGCSPAQLPPEKAPRPVKVIRTILEEQEVTMVLQGEVTASDVRQISFLVSGHIEELLVEREDIITPGTLVGRLDNTDYQGGLQAARAALQSIQASLDKALAGATHQEIQEMELQVTKAREAYEFADQQYQRMTALHQGGGVALSDLERAALERATAEASYLQAETQLQRLRDGTRPEEIAALTGQRDAALEEVEHAARQVSRTELRANVEGVVAEVFYRQGELYQQGTPLFMVNSTGQMVRISLSQQQFHRIKAGDPALVMFGDVAWESRVSLVSGTPDPLTRTYPGEVPLPESSLPLGQLVSVRLTTTGMKGTSLPMKAVLAGNPDYVYVVEDQVAIQVPVQVLEAQGHRLWVSGLEPGQQVVVEGMHLLSHGESAGLVEEVVEP